MIQTVVDFLIFLSEKLGNLGWAILAFTLAIRLLLYPINKSALISSTKMRELQPELQNLQNKYKKKPQELQKHQMELYKKAGVNPLGGCLPQIFQLVVVIVLYRALLALLNMDAVSDGTISTHFFGLDLRQPDPYYVLPALAGGSQFVASWLMMGKHSETAKPQPAQKKNQQNKDEGILGSSQMMQQQMMYVMPVITAVIAANFPAGISLYWVAATVFSVIQQWLVMSKNQQAKALAVVTSWWKK